MKGRLTTSVSGNFPPTRPGISKPIWNTSFWMRSYMLIGLTIAVPSRTSIFTAPGALAITRCAQGVKIAAASGLVEGSAVTKVIFISSARAASGSSNKASTHPSQTRIDFPRKRRKRRAP